MSKGNKFYGNEEFIIQAGLDLYLEAVTKQLDEAEKAGKRPMFTKGYFVQVVGELKEKVNRMTYAQK